MSDAIVRVQSYEVDTWATTAPVAATAGTNVPIFGTPDGDDVQNVGNAFPASFIGAEQTGYPTGKDSGMSFETLVHTGTKAFDGVGGDTDPTSCFGQKFLESYFGAAAVATFTGTTVAAASGPGKSSPLKVTSAAGMAAGMMFQVGSEHRFIDAISGTNITLDQDLDTAANYTEGTIIYGFFQFVPTIGSYAKYLYLNDERVSSEKWLRGPGRMVGFDIDGIGSQEQIKNKWKFWADTWVAGFTPSSPAANAFTGSPLYGVQCNFGFDSTSTQLINAGIGFGVDHKVINAPASATAGQALNGRDGVRIRELKAKISATVLYASGFYTKYQSQGTAPVRLSLVNGSTNAAKARAADGVYFPNAQYVMKKTRVDGLRALSLEITAREPTSAQQTAGIVAPFYFCRGGGV